MDFESVLEEILLGRGQGNLKLKPKQKEALQAIVFERSRLFNRLLSNCAATKEQSRGSAYCRSNCRITEMSAWA